MSKSHIVTAAKVKLYLNGKPFGRVTQFRWASETPKRAIYGIDSSEPYELASTTTKCTGSMSVLKISADGGAEGAGIAAPYASLSREKYFSLTLVEHHTDLIIFRADRCSLTSQQWEVAAKGMVSGQFSFEAIEWDAEVSSKAANGH